MSTSRHRAQIGQGLGVAFLMMPSTPGPDVGISVIAGQTATLLPDGRWLILGGQAGGRVLARAAVQDPGSGTIVALPNGLQHARAWHTATTLPDGTVLIVGGVDASGRVVETTEQFDPDTLTFQMVTGLAVMPRAYHTATLLTDGPVLIPGGGSNSRAVAL